MRKDYAIKNLDLRIKRMGSVAIVCAFIVLAALFQDARGRKPRMIPAEEMFLCWGCELRIECYGQGAELQFSFPENTVLANGWKFVNDLFKDHSDGNVEIQMGKVPRSNHEILQTRNGTYTFLRSSVVPDDAGWYACAEKGIEIDNHFSNINHTHGDIAWLYVYVKDDYGYSFMDSDSCRLPMTIVVVEGSTVVVPCRLNRPVVVPQLWQDFRLLSTDGTAVQYDPRIGFIIKEVDFEGGEAIFECVTNVARDNYVFRLSSTKPTMITSGDELILQEGDELKIECCSETKLSFLFPEKFSNSSKYEIFTNESGVNTFLRRSAVADDTGWYGCGGEGIQNDIPYHSINYTRKGISWIYVYVNSTVPITSGPVFGIDKLWTIIPYRPTSPRLHIQLSCRNCHNPDFLRDVRFDPKLGFVIGSTLDSQGSFFCTTDEPVHYVSKTYNIHSMYEETKKTWPPTIVDAQDVLAPKDLLIRMTGEDLQLLCEVALPEEMPFRLEWTVPIEVSEGRVRYNLTRADGRFENSMYLRGKKMMMTINNLSETDSGEYICHSRWSSYSLPTAVSRRVEVFDINGGRYIKLSKKFESLHVTGAEGTTVKWLVDLGDYPSARISWYRFDLFSDWFEITSDPKGSRHIKATSKGGSPYMLFTINNLKFEDDGRYHLSADIGNVTALVYISLNVRVPPRAIIQKLQRYSYKRGEHVAAVCKVYGNPPPEVRWRFWNCPKFPSREDSTLAKLDTHYAGNSQNFPADVPKDVNFNITISGILTCEACNSTHCSLDQTQILCSTTDEPYFTSTNLNKSEVTRSLEGDEDDTLVLECYAAGEPYPNVTWFKDNIPLQESRQFRFAYDNRELSISYFVDGDSGRYMCRAENEKGKVENYVDIKMEGASDVLRPSFFAAATVLLGIIVVSWVVIWKQRKEAARKESINLAFKNGALNSLNPDLPIVDQAELLPYDLKWEFPRELLTLDKILGSGAFGIVKKATAKSICRGEAVTTVAVKLVRSKASLNFITALTRELKILVYLGKHINIVNLLGACTQNVSYGELFVIVEYCQFGNLHDYLVRGRTDFIDQTRSKTEQTLATNVDADQIYITDEIPNTNDGASTEDLGQNTGSTTASLIDENRISGKDPGNAQNLRFKYKGDYEDTNLEPISTRDLIYWSWQVSRGMDYLGKRKVVHGDLAARNILLADNGIVKISDFGLSKALYEEAQYRDQGVDPLPVKWMAIESIKDRVFSYQSDIWSFGIVMWEFFTLAKTPYPGIRASELYYELINGHRMEQPEYAVTSIYDTMLNCWELDPSKRPSFAKLTQSIGDLLDEGFKSRYLEINSLYLEIDARIFVNEKKDYLTLSPSTFDPASSSTAHEQIEMETS